MVVECWVIIIILGITAYMFVRSKRKAWAPVVLPLMLVPFVNILYFPVGRQIANTDLPRANIIRVIVLLTAFLVTLLWVLVAEKRLPRGKSKLTYVICSILFSASLVILFIFKVRLFKP